MKKLKKSRVMSFIAVTVVYIIAATFGIAVYMRLKFKWWLSLLIADVAATVITFVFSVIFGNASVYDPYWSVQPPIIVVAFAFGRELTLLGILLTMVVTFWAIRLTANWAYTFQNLNHQDWRYTMLKEKTGKFYFIINFLGIHMVPTLIVYACVLPAVYAIVNDLKETPVSVLFLCISLGAAIMQGVADLQMHRYRKNRTGAFIQSGLWRYSRHPNYLGEILMWWGVALAVVCVAPHTWHLVTGAFANMLLFLFVSIPMADDRQSHKEGFAEYKRNTRMLLPIKKSECQMTY